MSVEDKKNAFPINTTVNNFGWTVTSTAEEQALKQLGTTQEVIRLGEAKPVQENVSAVIEFREFYTDAEFEELKTCFATLCNETRSRVSRAFGNFMAPMGAKKISDEEHYSNRMVDYGVDKEKLSLKQIEALYLILRREVTAETFKQYFIQTFKDSLDLEKLENEEIIYSAEQLRARGAKGTALALEAILKEGRLAAPIDIAKEIAHRKEFIPRNGSISKTTNHVYSEEQFKVLIEKFILDPRPRSKGSLIMKSVKNTLEAFESFGLTKKFDIDFLEQIAFFYLAEISHLNFEDLLPNQSYRLVKILREFVDSSTLLEKIENYLLELNMPYSEKEMLEVEKNLGLLNTGCYEYFGEDNFELMLPRYLITHKIDLRHLQAKQANRLIKSTNNNFLRKALKLEWEKVHGVQLSV